MPGFEMLPSPLARSRTLNVCRLASPQSCKGASISREQTARGAGKYPIFCANFFNLLLHSSNFFRDGVLGDLSFLAS
eukprot:747961-Hanusia_phi.AAC.3